MLLDELAHGELLLQEILLLLFPALKIGPQGFESPSLVLLPLDRLEFAGTVGVSQGRLLKQTRRVVPLLFLDFRLGEECALVVLSAVQFDVFMFELEPKQVVDAFDATQGLLKGPDWNHRFTQLRISSRLQQKGAENSEAFIGVIGIVDIMAFGTRGFLVGKSGGRKDRLQLLEERGFQVGREVGVGLGENRLVENLSGKVLLEKLPFAGQQESLPNDVVQREVFVVEKSIDVSAAFVEELSFILGFQNIFH